MTATILPDAYICVVEEVSVKRCRIPLQAECPYFHVGAI